MDKLISRLQFKNFEPGEFCDVQERTLEEVIFLIRNFPWAEQRHFTPVGPTCPSIMIEDTAGNYLKLGHHYYDKYCFYLYTADGTFLKKVVASLDEAVKIVSDFYNGADIKDEFESEYILHAQRHFIEKDFTVYPNSIGVLFSLWFFMFFPVALLLGSILFAWGTMSGQVKGNDLILSGLLIIADLVFFTVAFISWRLYFNHAHNCKGKFLKLSKGHNEFVYGTTADNKTYLKDQIVLLREYRTTWTKAPYSSLNYVEINFDNGEQIKLSSLLLKNGYTKFPNVKWEVVTKLLPSIK